MGIEMNIEIEDEEWRQLCDRVSKESDPQRLSKLLDQFIKKLDVRRQALHGQGQKVHRDAGKGDASA